MPRINVNTITKGRMDYFMNTINYVARKDRCTEGYLGATNLYLPPKRSDLVPVIMYQIKGLWEFFNKHDVRLGLHVEINLAPSELEYLSKMQVLQIEYFVANAVCADCMTYFSVHDHSELLHIDMLVILIHLDTGLMYGCNKAGWHAIEGRLMEYLQNFMPESAVGEFQVSFDQHTRK